MISGAMCILYVLRGLYYCTLRSAPPRGRRAQRALHRGGLGLGHRDRGVARDEELRPSRQGDADLGRHGLRCRALWELLPEENVARTLERLNWCSLISKISRMRTRIGRVGGVSISPAIQHHSLEAKSTRETILFFAPYFPYRSSALLRMTQRSEKGAADARAALHGRNLLGPSLVSAERRGRRNAAVRSALDALQYPEPPKHDGPTKRRKTYSSSTQGNASRKQKAKTPMSVIL